MLTRLIESRRPRTGRRLFTAGVVSLTAHTVGILGAVYVTAHAGAPRDTPLIDTAMVFLSSPSSTRADEKKKTEARPVVRVDVPLKGFQTVVAVIEIPTDIPPLDFGERFD